MKFRYEPPPTYFVHVPKTGGVSLGFILDATFLPKDRVRLNPPRLASLTLEELGNFRCYHAMHQGRQMFEMVGRPELKCLTIVRDPVERAVSQILYLQRTIREKPHTFTPAYTAAVEPITRSDLSERLDEVAFSQACDRQIRTLGIMEDYSPLLKGGPDVVSGRSVIRPYPLPPLMNVNDDALLTNACRWLGEMAVVGTTENYAQTAALICETLGVAAPPVLPRLNANPERTREASNYRARLAAKVVSQLEALTEPDRKMYAFAQELFREHWSRHMAQPRRTYSIGPRLRRLPQEAYRRTFRRGAARR